MRFSFWGVLLLVGVLLAGCQSDLTIVSGLTEVGANEVIVVLHSQKIDSQKILVPGRTPTYSIVVKSGAASEALKLLVLNRLPRQQSAGFAQVYPVGGNSLIPSSSEEKARYTMALQGEVENTLKILPGVVEARVNIVLPDATAIRDINAPPLRATASVAIVYNPVDKHGNPSVDEKEVQELTASAIEDLRPQDVTVVMSPNLPMKLVGIKGAIKHVPTRQARLANQKAAARPPAPPMSHLATEHAPVVYIPPGVAVSQKGAPIVKKGLSKHLAVQEDDRRHKLLAWLFGILAVIGLAVGVISLMRMISFKKKLAKMEEAEGKRVGQLQTDAAPAPEPTPAPAENAEAPAE